MKKLILLLLFTAVLINAKNREEFKWKKISLNATSSLRFIEGKSLEDFWVSTYNGELFHIVGGNVAKRIIPPKKVNLNQTSFLRIGKNNFLCVATTVDWKGYFFLIENGVWKKISLQIDYPLKKIFKDSSGKIFAVGDFGSLFQYEGNKWIEIPNHFESHISSGIGLPDGGILISVKKKGVVKYLNGKFTQITDSTDTLIIMDFFKYDNRVWAISNRHEVFEFVNNKLILEKNPPVPIIQNGKNYSYGMKSIDFRFLGRRGVISFPQEYNIVDIKVFSSREVLLLGNGENIYLGNKSENNFFTNLSVSYRINSNSGLLPKGGAFISFDKILAPDILITSFENVNSLFFFKNYPRTAFSFITGETNLPSMNNSILTFTPIDFDKDGKEDLVFEILHGNRYRLDFYRNVGGNKFHLVASQAISQKDAPNGFIEILPFDVDNDGDDDLVGVSYLSGINRPGGILIYKNNYWGNFWEVDTTLFAQSRGWLQRVVFADFNNDNRTDILLVQKWRDNFLLIRNKEKNNFTKIALPKTGKKETLDASVIDFDNDGDLDIFTITSNDFIRVIENKGDLKFKDISEKLFSKKYFENSYLHRNYFLFGDFNSDGFVDILFNFFNDNRENTILFINKEGKEFVDKTSEYNLSNSNMKFSLMADFDNDGDPDILGLSTKNKELWVNNENSHNFIKVKIVGVKSSTDALGTKIWLYKNDFNFADSALIMYRQIGTANFSANQFSDQTIIFSGLTDSLYDIKIHFLSGKEILLRKIHKNKTVILKEENGLSYFYSEAPRVVYYYLTKKKTYYYLFSFVFAHLLLIFFSLVWMYRFKWKVILLIPFILINASIYWLLTIKFYSTDNLAWQFIIPNLILVFTLLIPTIIYFYQSFAGAKRKLLLYEKLLPKVIAFSHGQWALRSINSILLLTENIPQNWKENKLFNEKLSSRFTTYSKMTFPSINEIIEILEEINELKNETSLLSTANKNLYNEIKNYFEKREQFNISKVPVFVKEIKPIIPDLRNYIYEKFSCNPIETINNVVAEFEAQIRSEKIELLKEKKFMEEIPVLIKEHELGNIIRNLFENSFKVMKNNTRKKISIILEKESPKIVIRFSNNGEVLDEDKFETIFTKGFSETGGTGNGLAFSREIISKYGGEIFVEKSEETETTFIIKLNKGK